MDTRIFLGLFIGIFLFSNIASAQAFSESDYDFKEIVRIINNADAVLYENYTLNITFDTSTLILSGFMNVNGSDLAMSYNAGGTLIRIEAANITPFNRTDTTIVFNLQNDLSSLTSDVGNYSLYYGQNNPLIAQNRNNISKIYPYYQDFTSFTIGDTINGKDSWFGDDNFNSFMITESADKGKYVTMNNSNPPSIDTNTTRVVESMTNFSISFDMFKSNTFSQGGAPAFRLLNGSLELLTVAIDSSLANSITVIANSTAQYIGAYNRDTWYRFLIDASDGFFNISIFNVTNGNNSLINSTIDLQMNNIATPGVSNISLRWGDQAGGTNPSNETGWDDIRYQKHVYPEPSVDFPIAIFSLCVDGYSNVILNFSIFDEENKTNDILSDIEATFSILNVNNSKVSNDSFLVVNSTELVLCTLDSTHTYIVSSTIRYENGSDTGKDYSTRFYFQQSASLGPGRSNIFLFSLEESLSSQVTWIVKDNFNIPQEAVIVKATRFFISEGSYTQVAMGLSDFAGEATTFLKLNEWYIFIIEKDGVIIRTYTQQFLTDTDDIILYTISGTQVDYFTYFDSLGAACSSNQSTSVLNCIFSDTSGKMATLVLDVERKQLVGGFIDVCTNTTTASSGTISCSYFGFNTTDLYFSLTGSFTGAQETKFNLLTGVIVGATLNPFGTAGIIAMLFIMIAAVMYGYWNPVVPIIMGIFGIVIGMMLQLIVVSSVAVVSLVVVGMMIIYKMKA